MTAATGTTGAAASRPRRRLSVEQRREQLIAVALEMFARHPPEEVSIDDIAAAAGASRPLVYHYFPGKQALYEEAIRRAGEQLAALFEEPQEGALSERLHRVMGRYLDFVDTHGPGFAALLRNASPAASPGTGAVVDQVRHAAERSVLDHLALPDPSPRMRLAVRTWIGNAEITALAWLADQEQGKRLRRDELQLKLVQEFVLQLLVAQQHEPELGSRLGGYLALERPDGPAGQLLQQLVGLLSDGELSQQVLRLSAGGHQI
ncbi:TetR family transcriptional regulator [Streptacidiphilus pinicola]|uniref:TetR family transcriptional regulator n=1 Tax=Streptacidiphilus pinicola TaxID=2219663 RepID=A0A2X0K7A3_9ACTN|nr:TetR/AcrR family transcriptional regulator [Streptacidiphilus pinicola]RAG85145.1 TetR family transcriptional regulator [Streptacidiphilus pinicola]